MDMETRKLRLAAWLADVRGDARRWYVPHGKQRAFHAAGAKARERLFLAGNRVGKTLAGACEMAFHLTGHYPDWWDGVRYDRAIDAWAASVTREATRDILQAVYVGPKGVIGKRLIAGMSMKSGVAGAVDTVRVRHVSGGVSTLGFKSFDQGRESFQGTARDVVHLDEEPDIDVYEECLLRTMTVGGHLMLTMTPLLGLSDMVRHFTAGDASGKAVVRAGWQDTLHLDPQAMAAMRTSLRPHEVLAREFGEPSVGRGRVFPIEEGELKVDRFEIPPHWKRCVGVDFGWSNPTAAVWLAHDVQADIVYVTDVYQASERVPAEHAAEILRRGAVPAVCDPAGQAIGQKDGVSMVEMYAAAGLRFDLADNGVEAGLMAVLERMRTGRLRVFADVEGWWREFRAYHRDGKGKIVKKDDHLMDSTRYAIVSGLGVARAGDEVTGIKRMRGRRGDWQVL
ncbi:MAG: DNA packaging protein [Alphaproteobacteria bacterium]|nr:MAG: DNA packaging protein [Alphaproteobacteria bacterium]